MCGKLPVFFHFGQETKKKKIEKVNIAESMELKIIDVEKMGIRAFAKIYALH